MIKYQIIDTKYRDLVLNIDDYFTQSKTIIYQDRNQLKEVEFNGELLIIKSFKKLSLLNQFIYGFVRHSKAKRAYHYAHKISKFTPQTVAYVQTSQYGLLKKSYLISQKFNFDFDMLAILPESNLNAQQTDLIQQFVAFTYELHQNGICHLDYWNGNILVKKYAKNYQFNIVDINRMKFGELGIKKRAKSFQRFNIHHKNLDNMLKLYAELAGFNVEKFSKMAYAYRQKLQTFKQYKQRLKNLLK